MRKRYSILRKKVKELESQLENMCSLPADPPIFHQLVSDDFHQRLAFLKSLLSAEMASSQPTQPPHHLNHIATRLNHIDSIFREWDHTSLPSELHHNVDDSASTCSCTDSCLDDGERVSEDGGTTTALVEYRGRGGGLVKRKAVVPVLEYSNCLFEEEEEEEEEEKGEEERVMSDQRKAVPVVTEFSNCLFEFEEEKGEGERVLVEIDGKEAGRGMVDCRLCGAAAVAFGVVLGMVMLYGGFQYGGDETFLTPT